jgi:hypothetical protein
MSTLTTTDDTPRLTTRLPRLTVGNFSTWLHRLTIYASAQGKGHIIRGTPLKEQGLMESKTDYKGRQAKREEEEYWVLNVIYSIVDDSNTAFIEGATTAKAAIDVLQQHHGATRVHTVSKLLGDLLTSKLPSGGTSTPDLTRFRLIPNGLAEQSVTSANIKSEGDDDKIDLSISDTVFAAILLHSSEVVKLGKKSVECALLGFDPSSKGHRLWDLTNRRVRISTSVKIAERHFPWIA